MKNKIKTTAFIGILLPILAFSHSGGTDREGGHHDRENGTYHFHHGEGPHQHVAGICTLSPSYKQDKPIKEEEKNENQLVVYKEYIPPIKPEEKNGSWWPLFTVVAALGVGYSIGDRRWRS